MSPNELLSTMSEDYFTEVVAASPKKFREEVFRRLGVKGKGGGAFSLATNKKNEVRIKKLFQAMQEGAALEDPVAEELIRNYLYTRRTLLAEALDFFKVPHDNGLTDADLDFMAELGADKGNELRSSLAKNHPEADVELYLRFMNIKFG
jgi:hypothetical protein